MGSNGTDTDGNDILLIVDQPDLLLAATGPKMGVGAMEMSEMILGLRHVSPFTVCWAMAYANSDDALVILACPFYDCDSSCGFAPYT